MNTPETRRALAAAWRWRPSGGSPAGSCPGDAGRRRQLGLREFGCGEPLFRLRPASPPEGVRAQPIGGRRPRPGGHGRVIGDRLERLRPVGAGFDGGGAANRREPRRRGFERLPGDTGELAGIGGGGPRKAGPRELGYRSAPACSPTGEGTTRLRPALGAGRMDEGWQDRTAPCSRMLNDSRYGG